MIRELLFSWEAWVIWYGTVAFVWTTYRFRKNSKTEESPKWDEIASKPETVQGYVDIPRAEKMSLNVEEDGEPPTYRGEVIDIRSKPDKPEWMK